MLWRHRYTPCCDAFVLVCAGCCGAILPPLIQSIDSFQTATDRALVPAALLHACFLHKGDGPEFHSTMQNLIQ